MDPKKPTHPKPPPDLSTISNWDEFDRGTPPMGAPAIEDQELGQAPAYALRDEELGLPPSYDPAEGARQASHAVAHYATPPFSAAPVPQEMTTAVIEDGKTMAIVSHLSAFTFLPLFVIPFLQKNNAFSLYHARQAAVAYVAYLSLYVAVTVISVVTCGAGALLFSALPLVGLAITVLGGINASNGDPKEFPFIGAWADKVFGPLEVKQLPPGPPPYGSNG
jgi:uncharacterized membrane protein